MVADKHVLPPEWNAEEDLKKVKFRCDDSKFSHLGRALATILTDQLQSVDLDLHDLHKLRDFAGRTVRIKNFEKVQQREIENQQSLDQSGKRRKVDIVHQGEIKETKVVAINLAPTATAASNAQKATDVNVPRHVLFERHYEKQQCKPPDNASHRSAKGAADINQSTTNARWQDHWQACKVLKEEKDEACAQREQQKQKLIAETIRTNRAIALA